jgi:septal ring factor EnvC (AmiA/AmiB activator)
MKPNYIKYFTILCLAYSSVILSSPLDSLRARICPNGEKITELKRDLQTSEQEKQEQKEKLTAQLQQKDKTIAEQQKKLSEVMATLRQKNKEAEAGSTGKKTSSFSLPSFIGGGLITMVGIIITVAYSSK